MAGQYGYEDEQRLADEGWDDNPVPQIPAVDCWDRVRVRVEPNDAPKPARCALFLPPVCASLGCIFPWNRDNGVCE